MSDTTWNFSDPVETFKGTILVIAPHMDDEMLACGATLAALPQKQAIHVLYATDGARSPVPDRFWGAQPRPELAAIRAQEAVNALDTLGIPSNNALFLGLPDGELKRYEHQLCDSLINHLQHLQPDHVFAPFRLDRHPDHLAVHRATIKALRAAHSTAILNEYFVYFRWRLLPGGDVRKMIRDDLLIRIPVNTYAQKKSQAIACYQSQTTKYFDWQLRPILTAPNIEEVCAAPEVFLRTEPAAKASRIFVRLALWIHCVHVLEPRLKRLKDRGMTFGRRLLGQQK